MSSKRLRRLNVAISLVVGIAIGSSMQVYLFDAATSSSVAQEEEKMGSIMHGIVKQLSETPIRNTAHVDDMGRPITKQQLLDPFVIPNLVGFSVATLLPGQTMMPTHDHETMHELFYVVEGTGLFQIDGINHKVREGTFLHLAPGEKHGIWIPEDAKGPLKMVVTGVAVGEKVGEH